MDWQGLSRRLPLPLFGCVLGVGGWLALSRPSTGDSSLAVGYRALWATHTADAVQPVLGALILDAASPERWADLSEVMHDLGRDDETRYCLQQELLRAPHLPHVAMRTAGMYFRLGEPVTSLRLTNQVINETQDYDANVFQTWRRLGGTAENVFHWGVGLNGRAARGYLHFLIDSGDTAAADAAWSQLQARKMAGVDEARDFAVLLTASHDFQRAADIEAGILPDGVWNGGFEQDWTGRGLDWQIDADPGVTISRDTSVRYAGTASLRLEFDGSSRAAFGQVSQTRAVAPGNWQLRAMLRTDLKGSPAGVGLRILDGVSGKVLAETPRVNLTHDWMPVELMLEIRPQARPIRIEIVRPAAGPAELALTGTAWIDDVRLVREPSK